MSYDNNKNRDEEKVFSVTMTEDEFRLFSEFLEQREFEGDEDDISKELFEITKRVYHSPSRGYYSKDTREKAENLRSADNDVDAQVLLGRSALSPEYEWKSNEVDYYKSDLLKDGKHRLSNKFIDINDRTAQGLVDWQRHLNKHVDRNYKDYAKSALESNGKINDRTRFDKHFVTSSLQNAENYYNEHVKDKLNQIVKDSKDIINKESDLANSKYDDKYSSKRIEKFLDKKIDADKAKNIVDRRHSVDKDYLAKDTEKGHNRDNFHISDLGRKWNDTGIVYNEALGRNLNKDAAIAAGVTAGLVGGGIALKKHLKKKKAEKELAENKYKTSDKKKKK